jgi:AcrR family transcriptional regulator
VSRTGRRSGTPDTREAILTAARRRFATRGYDVTSLRGIAAEAKVDPALVIHYFGTKEGLFVAATGLPAGLSALLGSLAALPEDDRVPALVRGYLHIVDSDQSRNAILALVRSAVSNDQAAAMMREFLTAELLPVIAGLTGRQDARLRASLVAAQLMGIAMVRHVIRAEPLARASPDEIVTLVTPAIDQYLRAANPRLPLRKSQAAQRPADTGDTLAVALDRGVRLEEPGRDANHA